MNLRLLITATTTVAMLAACSSTEKAESTTKAPEKVQTSAAAAPLTAEDSVLVTATATVKAIDHAKRELTLRNELGNETTFTVDKRVQRLNEINVGDRVTADYYISIAGELRPPTQDEKDHPLVLLEGGARAPKGTDPAGGVLRAFRVVTTVKGLDLTAQTVTLEGPMGNQLTIRARHPENLKKLKLDDTIVVTYTEALAISVDKIAPHK